MGDEKNYIIFSLTQGRQVEIDYIETVKKILSKPFFLNCFIQIGICGCNDPDIDFDRMCSPLP